MRHAQVDLTRLRREQIVEAAVAIITEQGLQNLSLSEIENRAGMSRGQLTYYYPTKEDILLAVFDRLLLLTYQRIGQPQGQDCAEASGWDWVCHLLERLLSQAPANTQFGCLQYTFLSQIGHREDFRQRLATLYEEWRSHMSQGLASDLAERRPARQVSPRALATLVQALLHGLAMQRAADPNAFDNEEMLDLCLDLLGTYLGNTPRARKKRTPAANKRSAPARAASSTRPAGRSSTKGVNGERTRR
jgi:AcrR family transcriptional regulator